MTCCFFPDISEKSKTSGFPNRPFRYLLFFTLFHSLSIMLVGVGKAMENEHYILRRANMEDLEGIKEISVGIYDGADYVEGLYLKWMDSNTNDLSGRHCLVMVEKASSKIVGYLSFLFQREGELAILQAMRVDQKARGKGLGRLLEKFSKNYLLAQTEHLDYVAILKGIHSNLVPPKTLHQVVKQNVLIGKKSMFMLKYQNNEKVSKFLDENAKGRLLDMNQDDFVELIQSKEVGLVNDFLFIEYLPLYKLDLDKLNKSYFNQHFSFVDDKENPKSISVRSGPIKCTGKLYKLYIDIYAEDFASAKLHLAHHLASIDSSLDTVLFVSTHANLAAEMGELLLKELETKHHFKETANCEAPSEAVALLMQLK